MSALVQRLLDATDVPALNAARLEFQRLATPNEVSEAQGIAHRLPEGGRGWVRNLHRSCFWEKPLPEPFELDTADRWRSHYTSAGQRASKELVIGFTGAVENLFHPAAVVLQQLDAARHELILIRDPGRESYRSGAGEFGTFEELVEALRTVAAGYRSVVTIGTSMGGHPALRAGLSLGARRANSVCGGNEAEAAGETTAGAQRPTTSSADTEVLCIFGAENAKDRARAESLRLEFPQARLIALSGLSRHNVCHEAFRLGRLSSLYALMVGPGPSGAVRHAGSLGEEEVLHELAQTCAPPQQGHPGPVSGARGPRDRSSDGSPVLGLAGALIRRWRRARPGR